MKKNLDQKVAIVTGGARGLGKGIANSLLLNGAKVVIFDSNKENGIQTESELNKKYKDFVFFFEGDVSLKKDNEKAVELAVNTYGKLDIVCANAGIFPLTWIKDISEKEWDQVMNVNLKGPFLLLQSSLNHFMKNKYGKVIFTSSITGTAVSASGHAHYAATKSGLMGLVKTAAVELSQHNINVNAISVGALSGLPISQSYHNKRTFPPWEGSFDGILDCLSDEGLSFLQVPICLHGEKTHALGRILEA